MKITTSWLKEHLDTKLSENQIIDKLTNVGLEVESVDSQSGELDSFIVAKILKAEKHPDADRLRICDVDIGSGNSVKVVCGAINAKEGLLTIYAPPGAVVPKNKISAGRCANNPLVTTPVSWLICCSRPLGSTISRP